MCAVKQNHPHDNEQNAHHLAGLERFAEDGDGDDDRKYRGEIAQRSGYRRPDPLVGIKCK